ncbi:cysteine desulfurase [Candidatus Nomurabacteria bacterium]|nr:cysteine desulfurase [Candidatus Nomurabacteria bacterium]
MKKSKKKINNIKFKKKNIYIDFSASFLPNPSSIHDLGVKARKDLENARKEISLELFARPNEIIFTSGGTESNNLAILGVVTYVRHREIPMSDICSVVVPHIVTTNIEHPSVLEVYKYLEKTKQAEVTYINVESNGIVDPKKIKKSIKENTVLVSVMYANNEIGTIQPIKEIAKEIRHFRKNSKSVFPFFHTDAVQAVNYLDLNVEKLGVDLMTLTGSKIENSGKVGILYKKNNVILSPIMHGGDQEFGLRPGTENLIAILDFTKAFKNVRKIKEKESVRLSKLRDYFFDKIKKMDEKIILNGDLKNRLPNNVNITIPKVPSDLLVLELSARGIYISEKSACKSGDIKSSHVIRAICKKDSQSLRFSMGRITNKNDIDYTLKSLSQILTKLKKWYN